MEQSHPGKRPGPMVSLLKGLVQVVFNNKEVTGIEKDPWPCQEQQVDISTTVERFQERGDEMTAYQLSTSDIITTPHEPSFPNDSLPPPPPPLFPSYSPPSPPPPYHSTQDQDQAPDSTPQEFEGEFVEEQNNVAVAGLLCKPRVNQLLSEASRYPTWRM
ncbi:ras-associated and pleckstrin homology domains-containing protein 1-like [Salmo trutta]|uniref:ras-associated and pleckstrin homology domains-containing protein 1-like n=1 Tax=Salmo trutta TaxID=8032 RepID=UPI001131B250|nr:ras-associated and pleckstrin homology domains-containing protein 1-like [Salmo trutta]XP_029591317.1 ras-associated and pleckstrin homology domains-containing protein 1-like [Salmo trutta]